MPIERLPFAQSIETRDGTLTTDSKAVNAYFETFKNRKSVIKRPGTSTFSVLPTGQGQGIFYFNNQIYAVVNNVLYIVGSNNTYTVVGTMTGSLASCYFNQTLPVPQSTNNTSSGSYTFNVHGTYTLPVPTGVFIMNATVVGAGGGGGGGTFSSGDSHAGGGGASGGYITSQSFLVTPGSTVTIVVGQGGYPGENYNNGTWLCTSPVGNTVQGSTGGSSYITYQGNTLFNCTGGTGGSGFSGAPTSVGGSPNGVAGQNNNGANYQGTNIGGSNGTGFGTGGTGGTMYTQTCGSAGADGAVIITY